MIESIYNFRQLSPTLATGGQPDERELQAICQAGFELVINLGLGDAPYAIADEQSIIESRGLDYIHLPVSFEAPEIDQFHAFCRIFNIQRERRAFIHCAANKRVSVFMALFHVIEKDWAFTEARNTILSVWEPDAIWQVFIQQVLSTHSVMSKSSSESS
ncbi:MAG: protein tyrosine phosphatase family protein [Candidatus Thiodiazotropha sp. (ex Myrtea sp. 'scaly one' KF741663)]|nr:protein tyrosine phosphatase family protein [Candidatus Thiodiazotropha sp. (ex Myrtea sp. 'scaly one' KF741663)]